MNTKADIRARAADFLEELKALCEKHGATIDGCGCCGSPSVLIDDEDVLEHLNVGPTALQFSERTEGGGESIEELRAPLKPRPKVTISTSTPAMVPPTTLSVIAGTTWTPNG